MCKEFKENIDKKLKEIRKMIYEENKNINKKIEIIEENKQILELKSKINE